MSGPDRLGEKESVGARRFDGERWWTWDGTTWVLVPDWDAPADPNSDDSTTESRRAAPVSPSGGASAPKRRPRTGVSVAVIAVALVALVALVVGVVVLSGRQQDAPAANYHDTKALAARLVDTGNASAKQQGVDRTITKGECIASTPPDGYICTLYLSTSEIFQVDVTVSADGASYTTAVRKQK